MSTDLTDYGEYLSGNDVYMRHAAAEYLGSATNNSCGQCVSPEICGLPD